MSIVSKQKKKPKKPKLTPEERKQKRIKIGHVKLVKGAFKLSGFETVPGASDREFTFQGATSDFDDIFLHENIIVLVEYTITKESEIGSHLKTKKILYDKIKADPTSFIDFFRKKFPVFDQALGKKYKPHQYRVIIMYCSLNNVKKEHKNLVPSAVYYDYNVAKYFDAVSKTVRKSARFEIFAFLGLNHKDVADAVINKDQSQHERCSGSILPEEYSNFGKGFKVVSFYISPETLLKRAYVLRKYGWRSGDAVYQRMISRAKIANIRRYLNDKNRVFINNIIVTLPNDTKLIDKSENTIDPSTINDTQPCSIQIPNRFNTIGVVDGQHRIFSYHEGGTFEEVISNLRVQQNLLVTGIIFPKRISEEERLKFEANLFLEINSNQTNARSDLKQAINLILNPFAPESIAKTVVNHLNDSNGPLQDEFERFFFDKNKIKTTSVVSFAVKPLVNPNNENSLFKLWTHPKKEKLTNGDDYDLLHDYVAFCASSINQIFGAIRASLPTEQWTADRKVQGHFLTTSNINGVLACLRRLSHDGKILSFPAYKNKLSNIKNFQFSKFKSSQYNRMGEEIYSNFFK